MQLSCKNLLKLLSPGWMFVAWSEATHSKERQARSEDEDKNWEEG